MLLIEVSAREFLGTTYWWFLGLLVCLLQLGIPGNLQFVVAACSDHVARGAVRWSAYHLPDKVHLPRSDHVADAGDGVKHSSHFVIVELLFADFGHQYLKDAADAAM